MQHSAKRTSAAVGVILASAAVVLTGCTPPVSSSTGDTGLTILVGDDFDSLDPVLASAISARHLSRFLYDTLLNVDPETDEVVSGIAESWDLGPTGGTLTLRDDVTCADGTPITASTVVRNFDRAKDPAVNAPLTGLFLGSTDYQVSGDDAAGTVTITLTTPSPFFARALSGGPAIVCDSGLDDPAALTSESSGTGPYVLTEAVQGDHFTIVKRDGYVWGPDGAANDAEGTPDQITFKVVAEPNTQANLILGGDANAMVAEPSILARFDSSAGVDRAVVSLNTADLIFNQRPQSPGSDPAVRTALSQAIDREELASVQTEGRGEVADSLRGPDEICTDRSATGPLIATGGAKAAAKTLEAAGWKKNADGIYERDGQPLTIRLMQMDLTDAGAVYLQETWGDLGVDVKVDGRAVGQAMSALFEGTEWDATVALVTSDSPLAFTGLFGGPASPDGPNFAAVDNPDFKAANGEGRQLSGDAACGAFLTAEEALIRNVDVTPLFATTSEYVFSGMTAKNDSVFLVPTSVRITER